MEKLESYKRQPETSLHQFIIDFEQNYNRLRWHVTTITEYLLYFKLFKAVSLTSHNEQLVTATIIEISNNNITKKSNQSSPMTQKTPTLNLKSWISKKSHCSKQEKSLQNIVIIKKWLLVKTWMSWETLFTFARKFRDSEDVTE